MTFGIKVLTVGSFKDSMTAGEKDLARAVTGAMRQAALLLKNNWRAQIVGAGLSSRLSNTVRSNVYPKFENSLGPAAVVKVVGKSPTKLLAELEDGAVITTARGRYLAVPTENVPKGPRGVKLSPTALQALTGYHLRFAQNAKGTKMLVADTVQSGGKRGGIRPATSGRKKQGRAVNVLAFYILVPQVTMRKRLNLMAEAERIQGQLGGLIAERLK